MLKVRRSAVIACGVLATLGAYPALAATTVALWGFGWAPEGGSRPMVTYSIKRSNGVAAIAEQIVQNAANEWNSRVSNDAPLLVRVSAGSPADCEVSITGGGGGTLGVTRIMSASGCSFQKITMRLSGKAWGQGFSDAGRQNIAAHEFGHVLGLGHANNTADLMNAYADSGDIFGNQIVPPSAADLKGIDTIYPLTSCNLPASVTY